ncbi:Dps family protein [Novosphingobium sp. BW1]|uniref:Dps family protein n=1 Tax=Novosphingobium sp. BW1 TaxID=2592621 RepID=UPI0011DEFE82|nr:DNA starvation/stationary phase protection protein [Novosphingobium sp. BW1]TYC91397.1 DNA starvation/stationary phase protection protein [Novosphingobium sp. BW1]
MTRPPISETTSAPTVSERFLGTPTDLGRDATRDISAALTAILADVFALYFKTKNFHWHMSGHHFRDYHLLLDEQSDQIFGMTDLLAERTRKLGGTTIRSISDVARRQRILDNNAAYVDPTGMLAELHGDNKLLVSELRRVHELCASYNDVASTSLVEVWIDETERRCWFLYESGRPAKVM